MLRSNSFFNRHENLIRGCRSENHFPIALNSQIAKIKLPSQALASFTPRIVSPFDFPNHCPIQALFRNFHSTRVLSFCLTLSIYFSWNFAPAWSQHSTGFFVLRQSHQVTFPHSFIIPLSHFLAVRISFSLPLSRNVSLSRTRNASLFLSTASFVIDFGPRWFRLRSSSSELHLALDLDRHF